jgi:hypothetical protein
VTFRLPNHTGRVHGSLERDMCLEMSTPASIAQAGALLYFAMNFNRKRINLALLLVKERLFSMLIIGCPTELDSYQNNRN